MTSLEVLLTIAIIAGVTFLTRALAFLVFGGHKHLPPFLVFLGQVLPIAIMGLLVIIALKDTSALTYPYGIPELLACLGTLALHVWRNSFILSVVGGTIFYMFLVQAVFK